MLQNIFRQQKLHHLLQNHTAHLKKLVHLKADGTLAQKRQEDVDVDAKADAEAEAEAEAENVERAADADAGAADVK